jgi:predicted MPP superfamily phosphohydrolase
MLYNLALGAANLGVWLVTYKRGSVASLLGGLCLWGAWALFLALAFSQDRFHFLALACQAVFVHGVVVLVGLVVIFWRAARRIAVLLTCVTLLLAGIGVDAFWIEPTRLETSRFTMTTSKLSRSIRIVVLADIQTDQVGEYEKAALRRAMQTQPDLILLPGDFIQVDDSAKWQELTQQLNLALKEVGLQAPLGVYAVRGNVDPPQTSELFEGLDVVWIDETRTISLPELDVTGLSPHDSYNVDLRVEGSAKFHVVFGHSPNYALGDVRADLLVAGHTHGGQVQLPFVGPLITLSDVPRSWAGGGLTHLGQGKWLLVSRGVGMERGRAPRLRFLCRPEVVVIDVEAN